MYTERKFTDVADEKEHENERERAEHPRHSLQEQQGTAWGTSQGFFTISKVEVGVDGGGSVGYL